MLKNYNKKILLIAPVILLVLIFVTFYKKPAQDRADTEIINSGTFQDIATEIKVEKIVPGDTFCSQISKEFVTETTGIPISRTGMINDSSITACDYYLTNEASSPYIAIILNKNLSVEIQKNFVLNQKLVISSDPEIITDHYIVTSPKDNRIVNVNLILDPQNFIRIDKNVERAIDNAGLVKLAIAVSKRL
jgi:hypothetical protein